MDSETSILESPAMQPARPGLSWRGLIEVFYKPAQFFEEIKNHPRILVPYLISLLAVGISLYFLLDLIVEMQIKASAASMQNVDPAQLNSPAARRMMRMFIMGGGMVAWALYPMIAAALAMLVGNFFMGGRASYKQILSVILYGSVLYLVGSLVLVPLAVAKGEMGITLSLAALMPEPDLQSPLWVLLSKFGVFNIWEIIVVGIGLATVYNFKRNKGYLTAVLSVGLLSLLQVASTAVGSMFR